MIAHQNYDRAWVETAADKVDAAEDGRVVIWLSKIESTVVKTGLSKAVKRWWPWSGNKECLFLDLSRWGCLVAMSGSTSDI